jgi:PAS domain S-box-containing protein
MTPDAQLFRDIFSASPIGIVVENLEGQPLFVNPAFCSMLGFSEEELRKKHCVDFSPAEDADRDWSLFQQLQKGSIDHYQIEKRYFRRDGSLVWGRLSLSLLNSRPSPLVIAMVEDITDQKRIEYDLESERKSSAEALQESEERLRLAAQAGRMFAYSWDAATDAIERSGESTTILGIGKGEASTGTAVSAMVHPDDQVEVKAAVAKLTVENPTIQITYRIIRPDGTVIWIERNSRAYFDEHGKLQRIVGMVVDFSERKRAEESLAEMTRKLIEAQEQERSRIGRELHDDINQRLALLAVELQRLQDNPDGVQALAPKLREQLAEISNDVQALSHDLHSSKLEYLGVVAGIKSWCKEFAERQRMEIDFHTDVLSKLPLEIGLCLFRVVQEALHNAVKHSGVKRIAVQLTEGPSEVHLLVSDSGSGFDVQAALRGKGSGLTSMRERVRLVNGTIAIDSKPMAGTRINVRVPLSEQSASRAAG